LYHAFRYPNEVTVWSRVHFQKMEDKNTFHNQFLPCPSQIIIHNLSAIQRYGVGIALVNKLNTVLILDLNVRWERRFGFLVFSSGAQGYVVSPSRYFYV